MLYDRKKNNLNWRIELKEDIDFYDMKIDSIDCEYFEDMGSMLKVHLENETMAVNKDNVEDTYKL